MARELLLGIQHRGTDATGAAWRLTTGGVQIQKKDIAASKFVKELSVPRMAQTCILHTRYATQGDPAIRANNHPIATGGIVGVHNGMVANDDSLFFRLPDGLRIAEVDSEAIFAMLAYGESKVAGVNTPEDALSLIYGSAAVAWLDMQEDPSLLNLARVKGSPLEVAQTDKGSLIFASERQAIEEAAHYVGLNLVWKETVSEGCLLEVSNGRINSLREFKPAGLSAYSTSAYSGTPGWANGNSRNDKWYDQDYCLICDWPETYCRCSAATKSEVTVGSGFHIVSEGSEKVGDIIPFPAWDNDLGSAEVDADDPLAHVVRAHEPGYDEPKGEWAAAFIEARNLFCGHKQPRMPDDTWHAAYTDRLKALTDWVLRLRSLHDDAVLKGIALRNHAWIRPGDWVTTGFAGEERWAEVVDVPSSYPAGEYLLRVVLPKTTQFATDDAVEMALIRRSSVQFKNHQKPEAFHLEEFIPGVALPEPAEEEQVYDLPDLKADLEAQEDEGEGLQFGEWMERTMLATATEEAVQAEADLNPEPVAIEDESLVTRLTSWLQGNPPGPKVGTGGEFVSVPNPDPTKPPTLVRVDLPEDSTIDALV